MAHPSDTTKPRMATPHGVSPRPKLLLVDDRAVNLTALAASLAPLGHDLVCAPSGGAALRQVLEHDFALIILDVQMPGLDGFETARLIKQRDRSADIPILFLTALEADAAVVFRAYTQGGVDYLVKPVDPA